MKDKIIKPIKTITILVLWFIICYGLFQGYYVYIYYQEHPATEYSKENFWEEFPEEAFVKMNMVNELRNTIFAGLGLAFFYLFVLEYIEEPKNHFLTMLIKKAREAEKENQEIEKENDW